MRNLAIEITDVWRTILDMENHFFGDYVDYFNNLFSESHVESPNYLQESTSGPLDPMFNHGMGTFNSGGKHPGGSSGWSRLAHNTHLEKARYFPNIARLQDF
ncbi:hypothetical protein O181_079712 [Austropuccinia psidii MF-1]|uniref:Uncharacterized protein n=1 Tax=Austropuccinia psidii MF-1 TaxID=1389203 RepID=A0A9Q3IGS8_9BASI|nr:hypothetical protein [Austropuccinia psidii MF-1]